MGRILSVLPKEGDDFMSLITVDLRDRKQLYEQLIDNIKNLILIGELSPDEKLPSVRSLAKELGINPNTIQKAYTELERQGVILTLPGRGSIVTSQTDVLLENHRKKLTAELSVIANQAAKIGVTKSEFAVMAETAWLNRGGKEENV